MIHWFSVRSLIGRGAAAALVAIGFLALAPAARAQGTLIAPGGQPRVTAPGGLRGRAALRQRHKARHRPMLHRRHR
ncbi:hypothetical protein ASF49_21855 [Methylobacterium sp. Leaf104]|uniref:hypothetical protein n=1 Tax=Methylobacterium TaxID=407 RepID=UPI0006FFEE6C|nr:MULTISPECIES: hypothetical protein [Methylobacterium]KQP39082.1 hypothetical protein ASF49_21855 [Methylobacterium sp. Leaf104]MCI9881689.1 hypothetical protein [Methylobacterium goesingense]